MIAGNTIPMMVGGACENLLPARQTQQHYLRVRERDPLGRGEAGVGSYRLEGQAEGVRVVAFVEIKSQDVGNS